MIRISPKNMVREPGDGRSNLRRKSIFPRNVRGIAWGMAIFLLCAIAPAGAQEGKVQYPSMASLEQYRAGNSADEIALARSAAPTSISSDAEVLILGNHGYETAVKGKKGFVCIVERSWATNLDDPEFCYMMSKQGYLGDSVGHWHPHLMFFFPHTDDAAWGANLPGSPVLAHEGDPDPVTMFFVPVLLWSDGTPGPSEAP